MGEVVCGLCKSVFFPSDKRKLNSVFYEMVSKMRRIMKHQVSFVLLFALLSSLGCGPGAPTGFPKLHKCSITVMKEGKPLQDAAVSFVGGDSSAAYACGGKTDAAGVALIRTKQGTYVANGAPEGTFKITLFKAVEVEGRLPEEEVNKMPQHERINYAVEMQKKADAIPPVVPPALTAAKTTPLEITIASGGTDLTIDLDQYKDLKAPKGR